MLQMPYRPTASRRRPVVSLIDSIPPDGVGAVLARHVVLDRHGYGTFPREGVPEPAFGFPRGH
ncbi:hypothetical protein GCM10009564_06230 [Streptomyces thermogriseus]|uniref:Uncharacterized protein n=1 Tax=Streptomyces thermogriseus TaxID=75292 RepID=A0ABN1ST68_9ACTN